MKKTTIIALCLLQATMLFAQQKFTLNGKVNLLSNSKKLHLGNFTIPLKSDGSFQYSGEVPQAGILYMRTDSSYMRPMWVEAGDYTIRCAETRIHMQTSDALSVKVTVTDGPKTARAYSKFYRTVQDDGLNTKIVKGDKTATRNLQKQAYEKYMDGFIKQHLALPCMPNMIYDVSHYVDNNVTRKYIAMLSPEMRKNSMIAQMVADMNRDDKLATGTFDDFKMQTAGGKPFNLSSLKNKKVVLIDFWASDCAPCRAAHPKYVDLYKKYAGKGLEIVSISLDNNNEAWQNAIQKDNIGAWVNVSDLKDWKTDLVKNYYINYIPFHLMLDGNRKILKVYQGGKVPSEQEVVAALK